jgi:hypothetical protein
VRQICVYFHVLMDAVFQNFEVLNIYKVLAIMSWYRICKTVILQAYYLVFMYSMTLSRCLRFAP